MEAEKGIKSNIKPPVIVWKTGEITQEFKGILRFLLSKHNGEKAGLTLNLENDKLDMEFEKSNI